jgi:gliding motility-associated-like protein
MSIISKINKAIFLSLLCVLCFSTDISATHIVGGELRYSCLGNDNYEVTLVVRRDCENGAEDAQFDDPAIVGIFDAFGSLQLDLGTLGRIELPFMGEDTITNDFLFDCSVFGNPVCVHEATYRGVVNLPFNKIGYCLAYQRCCRNSIINNIEDPLETGATFFSCITVDAARECNSQPEFIQWPDVYVCTNMDIDFDHSAIDAENDSLVYRLCTPSAGATIDNPLPAFPSNPPYSTVIWTPPFSLDNVLGGVPLRIDPQTGRITGRPDAIGTYVVGICVDEYRDGELLSTVARDFEYTVRICTDPIVGDFEVLNNCDGDNTVTFNNLTTGADSFMWFFDFPGTTLTSTEVSPTFTYPSEGKYTVRLEATRNTDGCTTITERTVSVSSTPLNADFTAGFESCDNGNLVSLTDTSIDPTGISCTDVATWTVTTSAGTSEFTGSPVIIDVGNSQTIDVTLEVISTSGCVSEITRTIDVSDLFPSGSFTTSLLSCTANGFVIELENTSTGLIGNNENTWTIDDNGTVTVLTGNPVQLEVSGGNLSVNLMVDSDNGCDVDFTRIVDSSEFVPAADFEVLNNCDGDNTVTFNNLTENGMSFMWFFDFPGTTLTSTEENPTFTYPSEGKYTVRLEVVLNIDGCTAVTERIVSVSSVPLEADFTAAFESCTNANTLILTDTSVDPSGISCTDVATWTVTTNSGTNVFSGSPVIVDIGDSQTISITLEVISSSGCVSQVSRTLNVSDIFPSGAFTSKLISCTANGFLIELENTSTGLTGNNVTTWTIDDNGNVTVLNGNPVQVEVTGDNLSVNLTVDADNDCNIDFTRVVDRDEFLPNLLIRDNLGNNCIPIGGSIEAILDATLSGGNFMGNPIAFEWIVDGMSFNTSTVAIIINEGQSINAEVTVTYDNGCVLNSGTQIITANSQPDLIVVDEIDCTANVPQFILTNTTTPPAGATVVSSEWNVNGTISTGDSVTFPATPDPTSVTLTVTYSNGCVATFNNTYSVPDNGGDLMIDFSVEPIECMDSLGLFRFTDLSTFPVCLMVESVVWVINGVEFTGSPIEVILPLGEEIDFSLTITFTDGTVLSTVGDGIDTNDTINTNDIVDPIDIMVENKLAVNCTDSLSLCVTNPDPNVNYEWSTDPNFENIIGMGTTLNTNGGPEFTGTVYVQTTDNVGECGFGTTAITIDSDAISLSFDMPFLICPGDTANFEVSNNNLDQVITYEWKGGDGQLISGADTNNPVIGIPVDATEDFFFVLCTSSDIGCTATDTIRFEISTNETLEEFQVSIDSCGSLTAMFDEAPNMLNGNGWWDFGDGSPLTNEMNPTNTYDMEGNYTVTLSDSTAVCPLDDVSVDIFLGDIEVSVAADTIVYPDGETPVVLAETNANSATISWCTLAGDTIFIGNPLEGYDPPMDTMEVVVKVEDRFGCTDQDTILLIRDVDNTEECFMSVVLTGPDMNIVCVGDTFQICVTFDADCNPDDFTYIWEDNGCIVSGQGTPKLTATSVTDKTFNLSLTSNTTGEEMFFSYELGVSIPSVTITVPPDNIDPDGNSFICQGEPVILTAQGDPDCEFFWSTGETGSTIEVNPEEATTYTVTCVNALGCEETSEIFQLNVVPPLCNEEDVFLPTAFSPNGDDVNDVFIVRSKFIRDMELLVQNRWGEEVFTSTIQSNGWDGTFEGKELSPDVYSYCLRATCINGTEYVKVGNVTLVK